MTSEQRLALQVTSAWLVLLAKTYKLDEGTRANIFLDPEKSASDSFSLGEAIDMAADALQTQ